MRALLVVWVLGCGRVGFDLTGTEEGNSTGDGGGTMTTGDGGGSGGSGPPVCVPQPNGCSFPGPGPCSCWGTPNAINAGLSESNGSISFSPNPNTAGAQGSCTRTNVPFGPDGVIVEVSQVVAGAQGLTALSLGSSPDILEMSVQNGTLRMTDGSNNSSNSYDPPFMRWWRIRPSGSGVTFETSPDAMNWYGSFTSGRTPSSAYTVRIIGGTIGAQAAPGSARFESVNLCP